MNLTTSTIATITACTAFGWGVINHGNAGNLKLGKPSTAAVYGAVTPILFTVITATTQQFIELTRNQTILNTSLGIVTGIATHLGARNIAYRLTGENISVKNAVILTGINLVVTIIFISIMACSK